VRLGRGFLLFLSHVACSKAGPRVPDEVHVTDPAGAFSAEVRAALPQALPDAGPPIVPPPPPANPFAYANQDPVDDLIVAPPAPRADCDDALKAAGIKFRRASIPVHREGKSKMTCGAEQVVTYLRGPEGIAYNAPPTVTCTLALALARFETIAEAEALRLFQKRVVRIDHLGTYACREMAAYPGWVSEHSYANAIDLEKLALSDGREISVQKYFEKTEAPPKRKEGEFLRVLSRRAYDEAVFSSVLTSYFDRLHTNHFHLDLARYRTDGSRPCSEGGC